MPAALPGVGPALPTAAPTTAASTTGASHAARSDPRAAPGTVVPGGDGPAADAAVAEALPRPDFKTLLKEGLGRTRDALAEKPVAAAATKKVASAAAPVTGEALAAAMAALVGPLAAGQVAAVRPAGQAAPAATATAVPAAAVAAAGAATTASAATATAATATKAAAATGPLAAGFSLALAANSHAHGAATPDADAAGHMTAAAQDPAKIAANGKGLPVALPLDTKPAHAPAPATADNSALLAAGNAAAQPGSAPVDAAAAEPLPGNPPVNAPVFADALGEKMVWMSKNDLQAAHLQLNPPDLGPLSIHLTVSDNQVSAYFVSPHEPVREAIAAALPRLQEMMSGNGMTLGQANVGSESFANANANGGQGQWSQPPAWPGLAGDSHAGGEVAPVAWRPLTRGRVDTFV